MIKSRSLRAVAMAAFAILLFVTTYFVVQAQTLSFTETKFEGWAWSENIGWISLTCKNDNNCTNSSYGVKLTTEGDVEGWAWSENIGWIKFGGLTGFPTGGGTIAKNAFASGSSLSDVKIEGWARACAATIGGSCASGAGVDPNAGGWDGWISLSGTTHATKLDLVTGNPLMTATGSSTAWGSDVVGWIDMYAYLTLSTAGDVTISGTDCEIAVGASDCDAKVSWFVPSTYPSPALYITSPTAGVVSGTTGIYTKNDKTITIPYGKTTIHVTSNGVDLSPIRATDIVATCAKGSSFSAGVCNLTAATGTVPTVAITIIPPVVRMGDTATVTIAITPATYTGTCVVNVPGKSPVLMVAGDVNEVITTGAITSRSTIRVTCSDPSYGQIIETKNVDVIPLAQET